MFPCVYLFKGLKIILICINVIKIDTLYQIGIPKNEKPIRIESLSRNYAESSLSVDMYRNRYQRLLFLISSKLELLQISVLPQDDGQ